ncbi:hypothetical protein PsorP6_013350 [Peronosclerospora sorghi]|uniref:Uncharacterized protein n=1 Tax=Peronosclerospora sorghi TaxID=230839 RepID=A0ACC0WGW5_9STRA|nr:hypothetical protein PsorP6_013350 [Peronosclerospora sorghi]
MEATAFSTGVSIQYPVRATVSSDGATDDQNRDACLFPLASLASSECYSKCQELAYYFVCATTRESIQALLSKNNDSSYSQVVRFFEKYCSREEVSTRSCTSASAASSVPHPLRDHHAPVVFPEFHAYPTAAVITGTDATSGELWVQPLMHKLRRTFPLCLVVPREVSSARHLIEWLAETVAEVYVVKQTEAQWMEDVVENFDLLPLGELPVAVENAGRRLTRTEQATTAHLQMADKVVDLTRQDEEEKEWDTSRLDLDSASESSEFEFKSPKIGKRKRRRASVFYRRWTMSKLLTSIKHDVDEILSVFNRELIGMLNEMVDHRLEEALNLVHKLEEKEEDKIIRCIACYDEAVVWLKRRITKCRAKLLNVFASDLDKPSSSCHASTTERALAGMLQRVFRQYVSFLEECSSDSSIVTDRRKLVKEQLVKHERYYFLKTDAEAHILPPSDPPRPFLLLCIEQMEAFSQQVFGDFLAIWTHFIRQQQETHHGNATSNTMGFIVGVATATAPALRRLDVTITNRLELQFFSLLDSHKCFDDVLEALVVKAKLPFSLSGPVLRAIASRHDRFPSIQRLLLALRLVLFTHFQRSPWSFLALAVDDPGDCLFLHAAEIPRLPRRLSIWMKNQRHHLIQEGKATTDDALASWLALCTASERKDLMSRVIDSSRGTLVDKESWTSVLQLALHTERRRRTRWRRGWECFRSSCSWLDVRMDGREEQERKVTHLALALEGRLSEAPCFSEVLRRLRTCRWALLSGMIGDWRAVFRVFRLDEDEDEAVASTLNELSMLCAYARMEKAPAKMLTALRQELVDLFTDRLVSVLIAPVASGKASPADTLVIEWSVLSAADVLEQRLSINYYDMLCNVLLDAGMGQASASNKDEKRFMSWLHDVGLAFLFYQESASAMLSLREWYESFASEVQEDEKAVAVATSTSHDKQTGEDTALQARFLRAFCTLRHWGFLKSDAPRDQEQDLVEKLLFI